jgi:hypothetical protein
VYTAFLALHRDVATVRLHPSRARAGLFGEDNSKKRRALAPLA